MRRFAIEAWGPLGGAVVTKWAEFNARYFGCQLRPVPLVITNTLPFGQRLAFCCYDPSGQLGRTITLNVPRALLPEGGIGGHLDDPRQVSTCVRACVRHGTA